MAEENDIDYDRKRALEYTIEDVERWEKKQKKKAKRADTGFTGKIFFYTISNRFYYNIIIYLN